jgi:hypothetical protein
MLPFFDDKLELFGHTFWCLDLRAEKSDMRLYFALPHHGLF